MPKPPEPPTLETDAEKIIRLEKMIKELTEDNYRLRLKLARITGRILNAIRDDKKDIPDDQASS